MKEISGEDFDRIVRHLAGVDGTDVLLSIPGVWEEVAEYYNNDALGVWKTEQELDSADDN